MRAELGESLDHLKHAAAHAAGGLGQSMGPRVAAARGFVKPARIRSAASQGFESTVSAFAPLASAAKDGARQARRAQEKQMMRMRKQPMQRAKARRGGMRRFAGLLATGVAVGAASAAIMRRRRRMQWDEYDTTRTFEAMDRTMDKASSGVDKALDAAARGTDRAATTAASAAETAGDRASSALGSAKDRADTATESAKRQADRAQEKTEDLISRSSSPSKNSRS